MWSLEWQARESDLLTLSDVTSFHGYLPLEPVAAQVELLRAGGTADPLHRVARARARLPCDVASAVVLRARDRLLPRGLVQGRTQTHLPWPTFESLYPDSRWHHDLLHADGTPDDAQEIEVFRRWCAVARRDRPARDG